MQRRLYAILPRVLYQPLAKLVVLEKIPRLVRLLFYLVLIHLSLFFLLRLAYWLTFASDADPIPTDELFTAFYLGSKFDLQLTLIMLSPLLLLGWIRPLSPFRCAATQRIWIAYLVVIMLAVWFVYAVDFGHYAYLQRRVDATVFRFLENFDISMQMVWQTYPVVRWSLALLVGLILYTWALIRLHRRLQNNTTLLRPLRHRWLIALSVAALYLFGLYGKFSYYPLRWSDAFFSPHAFGSALASNPLVYFFNTLKNRNVTFDIATAKHYYPLLRDFLRIQPGNAETLDYTRHVQHAPRLGTRPNVVMVFLESFAGYKTTTFGNPSNPTPEFDQLAQQGVLFTQFYTPLTGTARSVFAALTGLPDIELNKTSTRNPLVVNQHSIINDFTDYRKFYFIGGSASWGNIRGLLSFNIPNLQLYEEGSYQSPRMDVWGIDDLHLFAEANAVLRQQNQPFFAIIQTAGNHRPYNIPDINHGFTRKQLDVEQVKKYGFIDNDEYNAFRFMDHSIGFFMESARQENYFDNTLFVFFGDHGITGYAGVHMPEYMGHHELTGLHVPLLIYAPKLLKPQRIDFPASELDLLPTIAGLSIGRYTNTTLGRDLLDPRYDEQRVAFTMMDRTIGLLDGRFYYRHNQFNGERVLYDLRGQDSRVNVADQHPQQLTRMQELCTGIYETTKYMMYHNKNGYIVTTGK